MNIMNQVTWKAMWKNRTRTLVTIIGIILSAAVFTAILTLAVSIRAFLIRGEEYTNGDYFVKFHSYTDEQFHALQNNEMVDSIADYGTIGFVNSTEEESNWSSFVLAAGNEEFYETMPVHLTEGRLPKNSTEIILPEQAVEVFTYYGIPCKVGESITVDAVNTYQDYNLGMAENRHQGIPRTYTIVGICEGFNYHTQGFLLQSLLTFSDGGEGEVLYHQLFVKTTHAKEAQALAQESGGTYEVNYPLLNYYGFTRYANYNTVITLIAAALILVVLIGSIGLIYNAFSISVAERTKGFGLLSSIGATKKQLRRSVFFEAGSLCVIAVPLGLILGFSVIAIIFSLLGIRIGYLFAPASVGAVRIKAVISPGTVGLASAIAVFTVYISALIPARRATKVTPLDAIRQTEDYKTGKRSVRVGRLTYRIWGAPGMLAKKYYKVSSSKYFATILSLTISIILFLAASSLAGAIQSTAGSALNVENYDFSIYLGGEEVSARDLRSSPLISRTASQESRRFYALMPDMVMTDDFHDAWDDIQSYYTDWNRNCQSAQIYYLEDEVLKDYLRDQGIDPAAYLAADNPTALLCDMHLVTPYLQNEAGEWIQYSYQLTPLTNDTKTLTFLDDSLPKELTRLYREDGQSLYWDIVSDGEALYATGSTFLTMPGASGSGIISRDENTAALLKIIMEEHPDGTYRVSFYDYDPETGKIGITPVYTEDNTDYVTTYQIGAHISELPFGIPSDAIGSDVTLILPLSALGITPQDCSSIAIDAANYLAVKTYLDSAGYDYTDHCKDEEDARTILLMLNIFAYGFIILITLISAANIGNTVSTNIALRRRDLAMMKSIGLAGADLYRIILYESLLYASRSLLIGLPVGLIIHAAIHTVTGEAIRTTFSFPWQKLAIASLSVLTIVLTSMVRAAMNMHHQNLIEAVKTDAH